ncbi:MAG: 2-phosphosulfolactate phosphatase [Actinomycetota bacterium]|nr:2-phosphosulfolactate phosphatase [Actinomycetota bacterium]
MADVELEWGPVGAGILAARCDVLVVVDVLSFTTSVTVAVGRGALVWPHPWRDGTEALAATVGAQVAGGRSSPGGPSLSPASLTGLPPGTRLVLPSPNGSAIASAAAGGGVPVLAASLRNAAAVGDAARRYGRVGLVPAGERWPDGSLRPAYEDWVGAGAVAARLGGRLSPEAEAAALAAGARRPLEDCPSGRELVERGFAEDVRLAALADVDDVVPVLRDGRFEAA